MKTIKSLLLIGAVAFLSSCASIAKFPVSSVTPAAKITAQMKQDKNNNNVVEVIAKNLAAAERLTPPKSTYVVWILTDNGKVNNVGQLVSENSGKASLSITTSFIVKEIFITAEDQGNLTYPSGIEISRTNFNK